MAFAGEGRLAFVWSGDLYVVDGGTKSLRRIETGAVSLPTWSPDGQWLAFLAAMGTQGAKQAWVVRRDGTKPAQVQGLPARVEQIAWSPAGARLGFLAAESSDKPPHLWVAAPEGAAKQIVEADVFSFAWRPDGKALAYAATPPFGPDRPGSDTLFVVPVDGGPASTETTAKDDGIYIAGWWPDGRGILWWRDTQHSASLAADGLDLFSLAIGSHNPKRLTATLTYRDWISWAPSGGRALVVAGNSRMSSESKTLLSCDVGAASCTGVADAPGTVTLDPAWSRVGDRVAFVRAAEAAGGASDWATWTPTRSLWVAAADGTGARVVPSAGKAVFDPMWDREGKRLLFLADGALKLADPDGQAAAIVRRFPAPDGDVLHPDSDFYYGHLPTQDLLSWWRG